MHDTVLCKKLGVYLKVLRKQKSWSQKELSAKVAIRFQQLTKYEGGLNVPPADVPVKLAHALKGRLGAALTLVDAAA